MTTEIPPTSHQINAVTRWSQVALASGTSPEARAALDWLCRAYWDVLRAHAQRRGWRDADDAVQDFWLHLIENSGIAQVDQTRGRFRSWLLSCLDHHLADRHDALQAIKRGGGRVLASLQDDAVASQVEQQQVNGGDNPQLLFDRLWATTLLQRAQDRLQREHQSPSAQLKYKYLQRFLEQNGEAEAYAAAAVVLDMSEGAVKVAVFRLRERFRACLRGEVADTLVDSTPAAIDAELGELLLAMQGV